MKLFVVTREGVYRHEIVGIYTIEDQALARAEEAIKAEKDNHHNFHVSECRSDTAIEDVTLIVKFIRKCSNDNTVTKIHNPKC